MSRLQIVHHTVCSEKLPAPLTLALVSDLHNGPYDAALEKLREADGILILGDLVNRHRRGYQYAVRFLEDAPRLAPTFYAIGNHEWKFRQRDEYWPYVERSRVTVLDNAFLPFGGIVLGALSSAPVPSPAFLEAFSQQEGYKLLMCHHPEYFARYVRPYDVDLTLSGHAHGGQVQLLGRGIYSPGQGLFPRLTHGFYEDGRLLVSRGMTNSARAPRINNPCEMIMLHLTP
ncbi:MAG: metallophosphoesterase [Clostridia bacterium]|nr:metallophosphoesterase [Clostridia bacterium]